jgi:hypothetical protein
MIWAPTAAVAGNVDISIDVDIGVAVIGVIWLRMRTRFRTWTGTRSRLRAPARLVPTGVALGVETAPAEAAVITAAAMIAAEAAAPTMKTAPPGLNFRGNQGKAR